MRYLNSNKKRYLISMISAFMIACVVNHYYALTQGYLMPLTAIYVMQTSIGNSFYQGMRKFIIILGILILFALIMRSMQFFYMLSHDVAIGAFIGLVANLILLPRRADDAFRESANHAMQVYHHYFLSTIDQLLSKEKADNTIMEREIVNLPVWVFEPGFDSGLEKGYRFFLVTLEHISDVLFAMHRLTRHDFNQELILSMENQLKECRQSISEFFSTLVKVLDLKSLVDAVGDFEHAIRALDKQFHTIVPVSLELLDINRDYVYLADFIFYLKDLRKLLFKLAESLR